MRARVGGLAVLLAIIAAPASANAASSIVIPDGCGDASQNVVTVGSAGVPVSTGRAPTYDISSATLTTLTGGGFDAQLNMCGPVPTTADPIGGGWQLAGGIDDNCILNLVLADDPLSGRQATLSIDCPSTIHTPVTDLSGGTEVFHRALRTSEWSVAGDTVDFHLSAAGLNTQHIGAELTDPYVHSGDGARLTETSDSGYYAINGPGVSDTAEAVGALDLG